MDLSTIYVCTSLHKLDENKLLYFVFFQWKTALETVIGLTCGALMHCWYAHPYFTWKFLMFLYCIWLRYSWCYIGDLSSEDCIIEYGMQIDHVYSYGMLYCAHIWFYFIHQGQFNDFYIDLFTAEFYPCAFKDGIELTWCFSSFQDPADKKVIICDEKLKKIFGERDRVGFLEIAGLISPHFLKWDSEWLTGVWLCTSWKKSTSFVNEVYVG